MHSPRMSPRPNKSYGGGVPVSKYFFICVHFFTNFSPLSSSSTIINVLRDVPHSFAESFLTQITIIFVVHRLAQRFTWVID
ncbi:hypothetical protein BLOT_014128 [Blomia tropicalis]|nr:hypothetical protein BLOT_014128 [Blomia tropicalis]